MDKNNYKHKPGHSLYEKFKNKTKQTNNEKNKNKNKNISRGQKNIWKSFILNNES